MARWRPGCWMDGDSGRFDWLCNALRQPFQDEVHFPEQYSVRRNSRQNRAGLRKRPVAGLSVSRGAYATPLVWMPPQFWPCRVYSIWGGSVRLESLTDKCVAKRHIQAKSRSHSPLLKCSTSGIGGGGRSLDCQSALLRDQRCKIQERMDEGGRSDEKITAALGRDFGCRGGWLRDVSRRIIADGRSESRIDLRRHADYSTRNGENRGRDNAR